MGASKEKLIALALVVILFIQAGYLGWLWIRARGLSGRAEVVLYSESAGPKINIRSNEMQKAISSMSILRRPEKIRVTIHTSIPQITDEKVAFFTPETMTESGFGKSGMLCTKPVQDKISSETTVDFYYTPDTLVERVGEEKAKKQVNDMLLQCILYAASYQEYNLAQFEDRAGPIFQKTGGAPVVVDIDL